MLPTRFVPYADRAAIQPSRIHQKSQTERRAFVMGAEVEYQQFNGQWMAAYATYNLGGASVRLASEQTGSPWSAPQVAWTYFITDQQGSPRVIFQVNGAGQAVVMERNHYYSSGLRIAELSGSPAGEERPEGYAEGRRIARELNLVWQEHGVRHYDPTLGRFNQYEPLADRFAHQTPYSYADNDPINGMDPTGYYNLWNDRYKVMRDEMGDEAFFGMLRRARGGPSRGSTQAGFGNPNALPGEPPIGMTFNSVGAMIDYVLTTGNDLHNAGDGSFISYSIAGSNNYEDVNHDKYGNVKKIKSTTMSVTVNGPRGKSNYDIADFIDSYLSNAHFSSAAIGDAFCVAISIYKYVEFVEGLAVIQELNSTGDYAILESNFKSLAKMSDRVIYWNFRQSVQFSWEYYDADGKPDGKYGYTVSPLGVLAHELAHLRYWWNTPYGRNREDSEAFAITWEIKFEKLINNNNNLNYPRNYFSSFTGDWFNFRLILERACLTCN